MAYYPIDVATTWSTLYDPFNIGTPQSIDYTPKWDNDASALTSLNGTGGPFVVSPTEDISVIIADLGTAYSINGFASFGDFEYVQNTFYYSMDGFTWSLTDGDTGENNTSGEVIGFTPVTGRYIQYYVNGFGTPFAGTLGSLVIYTPTPPCNPPSAPTAFTAMPVLSGNIPCIVLAGI